MSKYRGGNKVLFSKLSKALGEPDDFTIWRYSTALDMSDVAWKRYARTYNVASKIEHAKNNGEWDNNLRIFLERMAEGNIPITAFLTQEGREWLNDMLRQSS